MFTYVHFFPSLAHRSHGWVPEQLRLPIEHGTHAIFALPWERYRGPLDDDEGPGLAPSPSSPLDAATALVTALRPRVLGIADISMMQASPERDDDEKEHEPRIEGRQNQKRSTRGGEVERRAER
jgi:hypothetical protein